MAMRFRRVLIPIDFSRLSLGAVEIAASFVDAQAAELLLVHVLEEPYPISLPTPAITPIAADDAAKRELDKVAPSGSNVVCRRMLIRGEPITQILRTAEEQNVDLIIMSTHGKTGLMRLLMGSVAAGVVRGATCPVITVTPSARKETGVSPGPDMEGPGAIWPMQKMHESRTNET